MAKKKQTRKKSVEVSGNGEHSVFWPLAGAILLFVVALFLLLGGFGTGGPLPQKLFEGAYWTFGWAAYLTAPAFVYWGAYKFTNEDRRMPLAKLLGLLAIIFFTSAWLF